MGHAQIGQQRRRPTDGHIRGRELRSRGGSMTEFAYEEGRWEPPVTGDEDATVLGFLERQRATFAWKSGDLDAAGLRATLGPSAMTLGGMLKHLARFEDDISAEWLHGREQLPPWNAVDWSADPAWDWRSAVDDPPERKVSIALRQIVLGNSGTNPSATALAGNGQGWPTARPASRG